MTVADYICFYLSKYHVKYIFGYPGAAILPLMYSVRMTPDLQWILMRHEYTASLAASARGKLTQELSVCMASSGPGATNLVTGILDAELDHAPILAITGTIPSYHHGLTHFQDLDQQHVFKSVCGFSVQCEHPLQIPLLLQSAIGYCLKRKAVAHISIAPDIQQLDIAVEEEGRELQRNIMLMPPPDSALDIVADTLSQENKIIIVIGPRARTAGKNIQELAEIIQAPMICSLAGKGIIDESHPLYFGVLGLYGEPSNRVSLTAISDSELVLAFGIDDLNYFLVDKNKRQVRKLIQCEPDISFIQYQYTQNRILLGDLNAIASGLKKKTKASSADFLIAVQHKVACLPAVIKSATKLGTVHQIAFFKELNKFITDPETIIVFDSGDNAVWASQYLQLTCHQQTLVSNKLAVMGFCLSALIAAKLEYPARKVVGICGDGGLQMVMGDLNTAAQLNLNFVLIIINNGVLQRVAAQQQEIYGTDLKNPDYITLAKSCGLNGFLIDDESQIEAVLNQAFAVHEGPVLIEVRCDPGTRASLAKW